MYSVLGKHVDLRPLAKQSTIEFALSGQGKAVLLHVGKLRNSYNWIQYDDYTNTIQLITMNGQIQELGMVIPEQVKTILDKTRAITVMEIDNEFGCREQTLLVFNKTVN